MFLNNSVQQNNASLLYRSSVYLDFFKTVFLEFGRNKQYTFGFYVDDNDLHNADFPIFSFQKHRTSDNILLPDIDFFLYDFYDSSDYLDAIPFLEKACGAVFVGATTGAPLTVRDGEPLRTISEKLLLESRVPRINSALNFRGSSDIYFDLPVIVQSDGEKTTNKLVSMGFGSGKKLSLKDQLKYKFILSMDGNGATCARVVTALKSQSVLMKYKSDSMLYYFSALHPWEHYIPIDNDAEVADYLLQEKENPGLFQEIAYNSQRFQQEYLSRQCVISYTKAAFEIYENFINSAEV